jgi:hypothetical protein
VIHIELCDSESIPNALDGTNVQSAEMEKGTRISRCRYIQRSASFVSWGDLSLAAEQLGNNS